MRPCFTHSGSSSPYSGDHYAAWNDFSLAPASAERPVTRRLHIGFAAPSRAHVDEFWKAGTAAGYRDDGAPGLRPQYSDDYYGAFLLDPDGNSAEAVHHGSLRGEESSTTSGSASPTSTRRRASTRPSPRLRASTSDANWTTGRSSPASAARSRSSAAVRRPSMYTSRSRRPRTNRRSVPPRRNGRRVPRQRRPRRARDLSPGLLRRLRPRSRREQHRGREPQPLVLVCEHMFVSWRGDDPPCRPRRVLRVGRAARRPSAARATLSSDGGRALGELRGQRIRHPHGDGRTPGPPPVPTSDRRPAKDVGLLGGEQGGLRGVRRHHAARRRAVDRRSLPRRSRAGRISGTPTEIAVQLRTDVASTWDCRSR